MRICAPWYAKVDAVLAEGSRPSVLHGVHEDERKPSRSPACRPTVIRLIDPMSAAQGRNAGSDVCLGFRSLIQLDEAWRDLSVEIFSSFDELIARIGGVAQEVLRLLGVDHEARLAQLGADHRLVDPVQRPASRKYGAAALRLVDPPPCAQPGCNAANRRAFIFARSTGRYEMA